ncbi:MULTISPECIES: hypothetical protein [Clostridium]|uniref:P27 family phage terminase small subunit n=1 Tax=Clostridium frigoriphilum TaxID=443253 RepID=A0ABU7UHK6_9CLOT|nr:hypothetical protein [Clostridium sp. DSM 17811]MBU3098358.1 hypothetical protein [Clostridium sp. DSM 17811]
MGKMLWKGRCTGMLEKAIEKLRAEITSSKNDPVIQIIGEFLIQHLLNNNSNAEKIMQEGKTIEKSFEEMRKVATTRKVGNRAVLTDQEGFNIVLKYFGIESTITDKVSRVKEPAEKDPIKEKKSDIEFNVELDF